MAEEFCALDGRRARAGRLCPACLGGLARDIADAPRLDADLLAAHSRPLRGRERVSGTPTRGITLDPGVSAARDRLRAVTAGWCAVVAAGRGLPVPPPSLAHRAAVLLAHLGWAAAQPTAPAMAAAFADAAARAAEAAHPTGRAAYRVGPCPCCGGQLQARTTSDPDLLPAEVACAGCRQAWPARELHRLGAAMGAAERAWVAPGEAARLLGASAGHVRVLAHRGGWARVRAGGRVLFARADVEASAAARAAR